MSTQPTPSANQQAYSSIMKGLWELDLRGPYVPCDLVLIGDHAFPLNINTRGQVLMAASRYGRGRIVVLGHEGYLTSLPALVENAVTWLRGDESDNLSVGVHQSVKAVADNLNRSSLQATVVGGFSENLGVGVYVTNAYSVDADAKDLVAYLKAGGGVLIAGQAWHWASVHPKENVLLRFPGNKVSSTAGIYFSNQYGEVECLPVYPPIPSAWLDVPTRMDFKNDLDILLKGVSEFNIKGEGLPSEALVHGQLAFPIGTTQDGRAFLAGAYYGLGRVILATHEGFLSLQELAQFWKNAFHWLSEGRKGRIGVHPSLGEAYSLFKKLGLNCEQTDFREDLSVFVCKVYSDEHAEEIQDFVAEGGGLLTGGQAWYWAATHDGQNLMTEFAGNHILNKMGLSVMRFTLDADLYKAPDHACEENYHFRHLLHRFGRHVIQKEKLTEQEESFLKTLGRDCATYLEMKAYDSTSYTQVLCNATHILKKVGMPEVDEDSPTDKPEDHLLLSVGTELCMVSPDPDALFPYLIKDNPTMPVVYNSKIKFNAKTSGEKEWISTGLYLAPGMKTFMAMPAEIVSKGWKVLIGCQTDYLGKFKELKRAPKVHEEFDVTAGMIEVWNLWGGLIYIVAPPNTQVEGAEVTVQMAVTAPYYKSGETTAAEWSLLRKSPAPWAEMEFENIILTVPSEWVSDIENPEDVASLWDDIMRAIADLAATPRKWPRKERFVADVQISAGWMHAGYPIMMHASAAGQLFDTEAARRVGIWGPIHELGHNQQRSSWEFPPHTTEATCNLWSVYVHEEVLGLKREKAHPAMTLAERKKETEQYVKGGRNLDKWNVWVALETYLQLQEKFGWDAIKKVFAAYHDMSNIPGDQTGKMNLYAQTFSQTVGKNLAGFFKAWGWPIEPATEEELSSLPAWSDHPMVQYG